MSHGLILLNTGPGKGKTTAALGAALRMIGHGGRVAMVQFIKSGKEYGELVAAEKFGDKFQVFTLGKGFVRPDKGPVPDEDRQAAREALEKAREVISSGRFDLVILDEITYLPGLGLATVDEILEIINARPGNVHVFLTGRDAAREFVEAADMASGFKEVKHPYNEGVKARKGVEY